MPTKRQKLFQNNNKILENHNQWHIGSRPRQNLSARKKGQLKNPSRGNKSDHRWSKNLPLFNPCHNPKSLNLKQSTSLMLKNQRLPMLRRLRSLAVLKVRTLWWILLSMEWIRECLTPCSNLWWATPIWCSRNQREIQLFPINSNFKICSTWCRWMPSAFKICKGTQTLSMLPICSKIFKPLQIWWTTISPLTSFLLSSKMEKSHSRPHNNLLKKAINRLSHRLRFSQPTHQRPIKIQLRGHRLQRQQLRLLSQLLLQ